MTTIDQIKRKIAGLEEHHEQETGSGALICLPDNGRNPAAGPGRHGNIIVYDKDHPAVSFMTPDEREETDL